MFKINTRQIQDPSRESVEQCGRELSDSELKDITGGSKNEVQLSFAVKNLGLLDTINNAKDITIR